MDRNEKYGKLPQKEIVVATRGGGVDRNYIKSTDASGMPQVATRGGGVDRNAIHRE